VLPDKVVNSTDGKGAYRQMTSWQQHLDRTLETAPTALDGHKMRKISFSLEDTIRRCDL
jgi:hypothetical protein